MLIIIAAKVMANALARLANKLGGSEYRKPCYHFWGPQGIYKVNMPDASVSNETIHFTVRELLASNAFPQCESLRNVALPAIGGIWRLPWTAGPNATYGVMEDSADHFEIQLRQMVREKGLWGV